MLTTALDLIALAFLIAFAYFIWPPLVLGVAGVGLLLISRQIVRKANPREVSE